MQKILGRGKSSNSITQSLDNNNDDNVDDDNDNDDACDYSHALSPFVFSARKTGAKRMNEAQRDYGGPMAQILNKTNAKTDTEKLREKTNI